MTVDIQPLLAGARIVDDLEFHFCGLGNFSGSTDERPEYPLHAVNRNTWDQLFTQLKPQVLATVSLPGVPDFDAHITFERLADFSAKGLTHKIAILDAIAAFADACGRASEDQPVEVAAALREHPSLGLIKTMALQYSAGEALDLLNMVDLGDDEDEESGPELPQLKALFSAAQFLGHKREAVVHELGTLSQTILEQVQGNSAFQSLEAHWRGLKTLFGSLKKNVKLAIIDCGKDELCDAVFLSLVKPTDGVHKPMDLLLTTFDFDRSESDLHILYHLGRMAESLAAPLLLNAAPRLFGVKTFKHLQHVHDVGGRLAGPEFAKWRKQRDETGSRWLFCCVNEFTPLGSDDDEAQSVWVPGSFAFAAVVAQTLGENHWPGELMGPQGRLEGAGTSRMELPADRAHDLGYEGFCSFSSESNQSDLLVLGMNCLAAVKIGVGESPSARDFVEFTLSYAFFVGCLSRFLQTVVGDENTVARLQDFIGSKAEDDVKIEDADGQRVFRLRPMFSIYGIRPDVVMGIPLAE